MLPEIACYLNADDSIVPTRECDESATFLDPINVNELEESLHSHRSESRRCLNLMHRLFYISIILDLLTMMLSYCESRQKIAILLLISNISTLFAVCTNDTII